MEGSQNIVRQALQHGVKKVVVTSSWWTTADAEKPEVQFSDYLYTADGNAYGIFLLQYIPLIAVSRTDWNPATKEETLSGKHDASYAYGAAKNIAEQELWKFADEHPEMDITTSTVPFLALK